MTLIAKSFIWLETTDELAERWVSRYPAEARADGLDAKDLASRLQHRASAVQKYLGLPDGPEIKNARSWDRLWNAAALEKTLSAALGKLGWTLVFSERGATHPLILGDVGGPQNLVIEKPHAEARAKQYEEAGLLIPFRTRDAALTLLAEELFALATEEMGNKPAKAIVDEIAPKVFTQNVLGLPFHPWAVEFL